MNDYTKKIKEDVVLPDLDANVDLLDLVDGGYDDDYYEAFHIYDKKPNRDIFKEAVKALEENEDEVECAECGELVEKVRCTKNEDGRYVCDVCKDCK